MYNIIQRNLGAKKWLRRSARNGCRGRHFQLNVSLLIIAFLDCFISDIVKTNDSLVSCSR